MTVFEAIAAAVTRSQRSTCVMSIMSPDRQQCSRKAGCLCEMNSHEYLRVALAEADKHGWKLMPVEANELMAEAAQIATAGWLSIQGSKLTVNLYKAKVRWKEMAKKTPSIDSVQVGE